MAVALLASTTPVAAALNTDSLVAPAIEASAATREITDNATGISYRVGSDYAEVVGYSGDGGELVIPRTFKGVPVEMIAKDAFNDGEYSATLTSITLPDTIEYIGANAFAGCTNVREGYIPTKFVAICAAASSIEVSENVGQLVSFDVQDAQKTKVSTSDGLASLYTEYTLDGSSMAKRAIRVPKELNSSDIGSTIANDVAGFIKKYSTIESVTIHNANCDIPEGSIPTEGVKGGTVIHGHLASTAQKYAAAVGKTIKNGLFVPLEQAESDDQIRAKISFDEIQYADADATKKFSLTVTAQTGEYTVREVGMLIDKNNVATADTAETVLDLDSNYDLNIVSEENTNTVTSNKIAENGYGLWVRPYVIVDNGTGEGTVTKYGEPQFIYSENHVKSKITTSIVPTSTTEDDKVRLTISSAIDENSSGNDFYELVETGFVLDRSGTVTSEESAKEKLVLDADDVNFISRGTNLQTVIQDVKDKGNGIWAVGYTTVQVNGKKVTKYSEPIYWAAYSALDDVTVGVEDLALSPVKFKMTATVDTGDLELVETGILTNKTGAVTEENAAKYLKLDSSFTAKQKFTSKTSECSVAMTDLGNGIWYVGYATVLVDGKEVTKYSEPQYVYSDLRSEGVLANVTVAPDGKNDAGFDRYKFSTVFTTNGLKPTRCGVIVNRGAEVNEANAKEALVLDSKVVSDNVYRVNDEGLTSCSISVANSTANGIWFVAYVVTEDGQITYSDPVHIVEPEDVVAANMAVKVIDSEGKTGPEYRWFDVTAITAEYDIDAIGIIVSRNGTLTKDTAAAELTLNPTDTDTRFVRVSGNNAGGDVKFHGNGIWVAGYATVTVNGKTITKYSEPYFVPEPSNS